MTHGVRGEEMGVAGQEALWRCELSATLPHCRSITSTNQEPGRQATEGYRAQKQSLALAA